MSKDECTVTVTREGRGLYEVTVSGRSSSGSPGLLAVGTYAMTRRGAFRAGRRIARDYYRRERGSYRQWRFTVAPEVGQ